MSSLSLTGRAINNALSLTGKSCNYQNKSPFYVIKYKKYMFDRFINPILSKRWDLLRQNSFQINRFIEKAKYYYNLTNDDNILLYEHMLQIVKLSLDNNDELNRLEENLFGNNNSVAQLSIKIPRIRLSPQYELYNMIIGKPVNNKYDDTIINHINNLLRKEYISYEQIEKEVLTSYVKENH